jgi:hypothetical protein
MSDVLMRASRRDTKKDRTRHATSEERDSREKVRDLDVQGLHGNDIRALEHRDRKKVNQNMRDVISKTSRSRSRRRNLVEIEAMRRCPEFQVNGGAEGPSRPRTKGGAEVGYLAFSAGAMAGEERDGGVRVLWRRSGGAATATVEEEERRSGYGGGGAAHDCCVDEELDDGGLGQGSDGVR